MITLRQLFTVFGHDPQWQKFATASTQPMVSVYLRKLGDKDIETLTCFDIELQAAMSDQPEDRKAKAKSCMSHLLTWAKAQGKQVPTIDEEPKQESKPEPKPERRYVKKCTRQGDIQIPRPKSDIDALTMEEWQEDTRWRTGNITPETSSKGWKNGKRIYKDGWRATIQVNGIKYHHRAKTRQECKEWVKAVLSKQILPTDNKADWWKMEQRKDEAARIDEMVISAAEESSIVYEYRRTGDTTELFDYVTKRLLPHMVYYCAHSLNMGKEHTLSAARQAVGLILTRIVGGRPITNITFTCKHMLRIHKNRGDFWYYEKAPNDVKMMVNQIDFSPLADVWKLTKDKRI